MADLSKIRKNGVDYDIKDATARAEIEELKQNGTGGSNTGGNNDLIITVEGYNNTGIVLVDVKEQAVKTEGYFQTDSVVSAAAAWNVYSLQVKAGEKFRVRTYTLSSGRAYFVYNANGTVLVKYPDVPYAENPGHIEDVFLTIPDSGVKLVCNEHPGRCELTLEKVTESSSVFTFEQDKEFFNGWNVLYGKKLVFCGGSITQAINPDGGHFESYGEIVARRNGMTAVKDGISGSTMTNVEGKNPFCVSRYLNHTDYDYITLWFGWNDNAYAELGTIDDTEDTTFYGAYKKVLEHYIINYPTKKIGLIVPYGHFTDYQEAVRNLSERYGVPCLDLADGKRCSLVWGQDNEAQIARRAALTYDNTHPNPAGYEFIATMYEHFLRSL